MLRFFLSFILSAGILFCGCSGDNENTVSGGNNNTNTSEFVKGADISWTTMLESKGYRFYTPEGVQTECTALMKQYNMNSIRLRVWVNPADKFSSKEDVLEMAKRAKANGMRIMIDFHYSDCWADPGKQVIPEAWLGYNLAELKKAVGDHTREVLLYLKDNNIEVEWVQVGNETADGMLYHKGLDENGHGIDAGWEGGCISKNAKNYVELSNAGYAAVKEIYPKAQVIVHIDQGNILGRAQYVLNAHKTYGGKYDIIGLSLYPGQDWQTPVKSCIENISALASQYGRKVMIVETGMDYWYEDNGYAMLSYLLENAKKSTSCLGVLYWEPEAPVEEGYHLGAFTGSKPNHIMDAFKEAGK